MRKIFITIWILLVTLTLIACSRNSASDAVVTPKDISKTYENEDLGLMVSYPETYTVEEDKGSITMYHYKKQPVPYFTINFSEKTADALIGEIKEKIASKENAKFSGREAIKITLFNKELSKNVDFFYLNNKDKTFWFSCFDGLYDQVCNSIKFND